MNKERFTKLIAICNRAEEKYGNECVDRFGSRMSRMMDLQSADEEFHLRLDELLNADEVNFTHDVFGIWRESDRTTYPCTFGFFVPRYAETDTLNTKRKEGIDYD